MQNHGRYHTYIAHDPHMHCKNNLAMYESNPQNTRIDDTLRNKTTRS